MIPMVSDPSHVAFNGRPCPRWRGCIKALILAVVAKVTRGAVALQGRLMRGEPLTKSFAVAAGSGPVPKGLAIHSTVYVTSQTPTSMSVLSKVNRKEYQPKRLIDSSFSLAQHCSLQRVKEVSGRILTKFAESLSRITEIYLIRRMLSKICSTKAPRFEEASIPGSGCVFLLKERRRASSSRARPSSRGLTKLPHFQFEQSNAESQY